MSLLHERPQGDDMLLDDQIHGKPGKKKYRKYTIWVMSDWKVIILLLSILSLPFLFIEGEDRWVEGSITHVNGTVTDRSFIVHTGSLSNGSDPLDRIEVDGEWYMAYEVDLDRWGDRGKSIARDYKVGDHIEMDLFPKSPFWIFRDGMIGMMFLPLFMISFMLILSFCREFKTERIK